MAYVCVLQGILKFPRITWMGFRRVHWRHLFYTFWEDSMPQIESAIKSVKQQRDLIDTRRQATSSGVQFQGVNEQEL